ncbi:DUF4430 domain-containing protein [Paraclostridium sordellii]|uniref:Surface/cell-adhesion protein n=1 Tax=Paraclostridium sordellii TaxID=1505 RepID=A0A0C7QRZ7_PARSO|nr:DUF4430 domain-containing protein [Paeniclostridium sordellii]CEN78189.1 surface/cell-adhesion protein [[Clostridium] sordellii] [Paeniclostridium sordellii]CEO07893.1 surface/cell-adhesion protein [[Clostridium] sordellii] [Paeniclostridium sordellii]CEP87028.1 surface/cell-adhesion protein [[Clostridium] sordellii] [Paeniclostridium sordellii]CEP95365.1 surface/cell-adhesion protein [[Clostridium] sordellii] [Paeniclostridium sordellii]CEP99295.1 surface/cell-adhesion protein [[Clostridiu
MKKKIKFILIAVITFILSAFIAGCNNEELSRTSDIPQNGIIKASVFKELKKSQDMALFNGESGKFKYQWMFLGSDIEKPEDLNLLIEFNDKNIDKIKKETKSDVVKGFKYKENKAINSKPALSITLDENCNITSADIYKYNGADGSITKLSGATVQNSEDTTVNFSVLDRDGEFYIVGSDPKQEAIDKDNKDSNKKEKTENRKTDKSNNVDKSKEQQKEESLSVKEQLGINTDSGKPNTNGKDKYLTDKIPEGKPKPVEPENIQVDKSKKKYATLSVRCDTLLKPENMKIATKNGKGDMIPSNGIIFSQKQVEFFEGESVFDVLLREMKGSGIHMEHVFTPMYNSAYIEGINNLYEFDGGELSGWMYKVNGWFPNYGCSRYEIKEGDVIEWVYTCDLGRDVGCEWLGDK